MSKLKLCPECHSDMKLSKREINQECLFQVICPNEDCEVKKVSWEHPFFLSGIAAIENWNSYLFTIYSLRMENVRLRAQLEEATQALQMWKAWLDADDMMDVEANLHSAEYKTEQFLKGGE